MDSPDDLTGRLTPEEEPVDPLQQAIEILHIGMRSDDERRRIDASAAYMQYCLAQEIGQMISFLAGSRDLNSLEVEGRNIEELQAIIDYAVTHGYEG